MGYFKFAPPAPSENTIQGDFQPLQIDYDGLPVTPADATNLPGGVTKGIFVTGAGNVAVTLFGGGTAVLTGLSAGQFLPIAVTIIAATSTTATGIFALY